MTSLHPTLERLLSAPPPADERIAYGELPSQFGDLRLPRLAGDGSYPVVVYLHGGFWRAAYSLDLGARSCAELTATHGFATWNLEYRRLGEDGGGWPGTFQDVARGADHLRHLAQQYPLDLERVVFIGHSAGGHLALWLAARSRIPEGDPLAVGSPLQPRGAVSLAGVVDLRRGWELNLSNGVVGDLLGGSPDEVPDRYAAASPVELLPTGLPQVLIHGTADDRVPYELSRAYLEAAIACGDDAELITLPDADHFEVIDPESHAWPHVLGAVQRLVGQA